MGKIESASYDICILDGLPLEESPAYKQYLIFMGAAEAPEITDTVTVDYRHIMHHGSEELREVVHIITNHTPPGGIRNEQVS